MTTNIKYRALKAFLLAVDTGSFTHAASQLGVTQSSLTVMIQLLEQTLGVRLFERTTRSISLTPEGNDFLSRIRRPLADIEDAYFSVQDSGAAKRNTIVIGMLPSMSALVAPALEALHAAVPTLRARVVVERGETLLLWLRTNRIECAVTALRGPARDLVIHPLLEDWFCAVFKANHPLAMHKRLNWDDLVDQDMILLSEGESRTLFDGVLNSRRGVISSTPRCEVSQIVGATALARAGLGITLLPRLMLPEINLEGLLARRLNASSARRRICSVSRHDRNLKPMVGRFVEQVEKVIPHIERKLRALEDYDLLK